MGSINMHVQAAAEAMCKSATMEHVITSFVPAEWEAYIGRKLSLFASGMGPDIFITDGSIHLYRFIENGFLMNINEIIPDRTRFYENVLTGYEVDGRLYAFPLSFGFDMVGINASLPQTFLARFQALETASALQLFEIYSDLIEAYPEFAGYYFTNAFVPNLSLEYAVDFHMGEVNFPPGAADLLYGIRKHVRGNTSTSDPASRAEEIYVNTVFHMPRGYSAMSDSFFTFEDELFIHYIPIADEDGALINRSFGFGVAVGVNADPAAAWSFIEALTAQTAGSLLGGRQGSVHISRAYAHDYVMRGVENDLAQFSLRPITDNEAVAVNTATAHILAHAERPSIRPADGFLLPFEIVNAPLFEFLSGESDAAAAIREMEFALEYWMNQPRPIESIFQGQPTNDLPTRTLTIHASNRHSGMFRQAARAMNTSWQTQGRPYTFQLIMDDYAWTDNGGATARQMRLQTELMAGLGPDIFIAYPAMNLRAFARNGFLTDFYTLIDNCNQTQRSDFFEHILEAFQFGDGLFIFPTSFSFIHAGINANVPQMHQSHFENATVITPNDMLDIYIGLREDPQYAYLTPGLDWQTLATPTSLLQTTLSAFIDFNTSTANLTDPLFVAQLEHMLRVFERDDHLGGSGFISHIPHTNFYRDIANEAIFEMGNFQLMSIAPFFPRITNYFVHYRPLADDTGRLMIDPFGVNNAWALLAVNAGGQPDLAWEFIVYLLNEYSNASGLGAVDGVFNLPTEWAGRGVASNIMRQHALCSPRRTFETATELPRYNEFDSTIGRYITSPGLAYSLGLDLDDRREELIDGAIVYIAQLNELPVVLLHPMIPHEIFTGPNGENLTNFMAGGITPEAFAQMIHNSITMWLIE